VGGKQGNAYLLGQSSFTAPSDERHPCSEDASTDQSLLSPEPQPQFGKRGRSNFWTLFRTEVCSTGRRTGATPRPTSGMPRATSTLFTRATTRILRTRRSALRSSPGAAAVIAFGGHPSVLSGGWAGDGLRAEESRPPGDQQQRWQGWDRVGVGRERASAARS